MGKTQVNLCLESLKNDWPAGYLLPKFNISDMVRRTKETPTWLHIGAGNIFRVFIAGLQQDMLEAGLVDTGIIVYEAYDEEIVPTAFAPYDNLTLAVSLNADGSTDKRVIAGIADAFTCNQARLNEVFVEPSLQMVSFTITEKGYAATPGQICASPDTAKTAMEQVTVGLYARFQAGEAPLALVAMDNFAKNGVVVSSAVNNIAKEWVANGCVPESFLIYVQSLAYPWTMIDKITPQPSKTVADLLEKDGFASTKITETAKHTFVAPFVNAEAPQYLVIEDNFPNGRPPLEKADAGAGVFFTTQETVRKADQMKVCACLNPLHTILGVCGSLLGYPTIASCMEDKNLVALLHKAANEAMPVVADPGILNPRDFLEEVITQRFPNPFIPDTPARINFDASQKIPVRFGVTLKSRLAAGLDLAGLTAIPTFIALWLRFRMGLDDAGEVMTLSADPRLPEAVKVLDGLPLGDVTHVDLKPILSDAGLFGVDLYEVGLADKITGLFIKLAKAPGTTQALLSGL